jgi:hypothetical protein
LERLLGVDFVPCKTNLIWILPSQILDQVSQDLKRIIAKSPPPYQTLPYLMATFKQHKGKYRWLINAYCTMFSTIAILLIINSKLLLETFKEWGQSKKKVTKLFFKLIQVYTL